MPHPHRSTALQDPSILPPLPESPSHSSCVLLANPSRRTSISNEDCVTPSPQFKTLLSVSPQPKFTGIHPLPNTPTNSSGTHSQESDGTVSNLAVGLWHLNLNSEMSVSLTPQTYLTHPAPLSETSHIEPNLTSESHPIRNIDKFMMYSGDKIGLSEEERFQRDEIALETKLLDGAVKFEHLNENGSNFIEWQKNANRAMYELFSVEDYWESTPLLDSYVNLARNKIASMFISRSIHNSLKDVTDRSKSAHDAMRKLQIHFSKGGRTHQFSLFNRLVHMRLDLSMTEMITHMASIDAIVLELESTGFIWNSDSVKGLFYQLHMPAEMTREINKDLDAKYDERDVNFKLNDVKGAIQIYLAREKTASETITISSLNT